MTYYTLFPNNDKRQTDGNAITGTSTVIDGGTGAAYGTAVPGSGVMTGNLQLGDRKSVFSTQLVQGKTLFGAFQSSTTAITSVADNGSGFCRYTLTTHGLSVGTTINVTGSTSGNVDGVQKITAVPTANTFDTDQAYVASASAGSYATVAGNFATLTAGSYLIRGYSLVVAGGQVTLPAYGNDYGIRRSIHQLEAMRTVRVATAIRAGYWHIFEGTWTTAPTEANDISLFETNGTDDAANPSRAIPGELVYRTSGQQDGSTGWGVTEDDYSAKTGG